MSPAPVGVSRSHPPTDLEKVLRKLTVRSGSPRSATYSIPSIWIDPFSSPKIVKIDPAGFYADRIKSILENKSDLNPGPGNKGEWSREAVVYDLLVRATTAFDHDGDGVISPEPGPAGWRETGTFLKGIAILPFIRSLGFNTIHLLPVQEIGLDGRRGNMGSVYAVRDLGMIDENLSEPTLGLPSDTQFKAFIQAAHLAGLRVVLEFPLRTVSKDARWVGEHPDWFYWVRTSTVFSPPTFDGESIRVAGDKISRGERDNLPAPDESYVGAFSMPPKPDTLRKVGERWVGTAPGGDDVVVPGAFADWPPDDHQPVWDDVTYLKYFESDRFNYIAYNTIRMYDSSLLEHGTPPRGLWDALADVVSMYVAEFAIDGVMVDMAHALPANLTRKIIGNARKSNQDVAFWAEDFDRTAEQVSEGYNVVLGGQWACQHHPRDFHSMLRWISRTQELPPHLAAPETHNTPRAISRPGGGRFSRYAWAISNFIPAIPYMQSGFELGETLPTNTGLGFSRDEVNRFGPDSLPLFSAVGYDWSGGEILTGFIRRISDLRVRFRKSCAPFPGGHFTMIDGGAESVLAFRRSSPRGEDPFLVVGNSDMERSVSFNVPVGDGKSSLRDEFSGAEYRAAAGLISGSLEPAQVLFFPL